MEGAKPQIIVPLNPNAFGALPSGVSTVMGTIYKQPLYKVYITYCGKAPTNSKNGSFDSIGKPKLSQADYLKMLVDVELTPRWISKPALLVVFKSSVDKLEPGVAAALRPSDNGNTLSFAEFLRSLWYIVHTLGTQGNLYQCLSELEPMAVLVEHQRLFLPRESPAPAPAPAQKPSPLVRESPAPDMDKGSRTPSVNSAASTGLSFVSPSVSSTPLPPSWSVLEDLKFGLDEAKLISLICHIEDMWRKKNLGPPNTFTGRKGRQIREHLPGLVAGQRPFTYYVRQLCNHENQEKGKRRLSVVPWGLQDPLSQAGNPWVAISSVLDDFFRDEMAKLSAENARKSSMVSLAPDRDRVAASDASPLHFTGLGNLAPPPLELADAPSPVKQASPSQNKRATPGKGKDKEGRKEPEAPDDGGGGGKKQDDSSSEHRTAIENDNAAGVQRGGHADGRIPGMSDVRGDKGKSDAKEGKDKSREKDKAGPKEGGAGDEGSKPAHREGGDPKPKPKPEGEGEGGKKGNGVAKKVDAKGSPVKNAAPAPKGKVDDRPKEMGLNDAKQDGKKKACSESPAPANRFGFRQSPAKAAKAGKEAKAMKEPEPEFEPPSQQQPPQPLPQQQPELEPVPTAKGGTVQTQLETDATPNPDPDAVLVVQLEIKAVDGESAVVVDAQLVDRAVLQAPSSLYTEVRLDSETAMDPPNPSASTSLACKSFEQSAEAGAAGPLAAERIIADAAAAALPEEERAAKERIDKKNDVRIR
jgi:hypothetical protein